MPQSKRRRENEQSGASSSGRSDFMRIRTEWQTLLGAAYSNLIVGTSFNHFILFNTFKTMPDKTLNTMLSLFDSIHDFYKGSRSSDLISERSFSTQTTIYTNYISDGSSIEPQGLAFLYSLYRDTGNTDIKISIALLDMFFHIQKDFYQDVKNFIRKSTKTQIAHVPFSMLPNQFSATVLIDTQRPSRHRKIASVDELENLIWLLCILRMESKVDTPLSTGLIGSTHKSVSGLISDVMLLSSKHYFHVDAGWSINEDVYHLENQSPQFNAATHTTIAQYMDPSNGGGTTWFKMIYHSRPSEKPYTINRIPDVMYNSHRQGEYDGVDYKFEYYVDIHQSVHSIPVSTIDNRESLVQIENQTIKQRYIKPRSKVIVEQPYIIRALVTPHSRNKEKGYKDKTIVLYWGKKDGNMDVKCSDDEIPQYITPQNKSHYYSKDKYGSIMNLYCKGGDMIGVSKIAFEINKNIGDLTSSIITETVFQENVKFLLDLKRAGDSFQFKFANDLKVSYDYNPFVLTGDRMASTIAMVNNYQHISSISSQIYIYRQLKKKDKNAHKVYKFINESNRLKTIKSLESFEKKLRELLISVVERRNPRQTTNVRQLRERQIQQIQQIQQNLHHLINRNNYQLNGVYDELSGEDLNAASALLELGSRNAMQP